MKIIILTVIGLALLSTLCDAQPPKKPAKVYTLYIQVDSTSFNFVMSKLDTVHYIMDNATGVPHGVVKRHIDFIGLLMQNFMMEKKAQDALHLPKKH